MKNARRAPVIVVIVSALVLGALADRPRRPVPSLSIRAAGLASMPAAAPANALSSTWYCAAGAVSADGSLSGVVVIANPTEEEILGTISVVAAGPAPNPVTAPIDVKPLSSLAVSLATVSTGHVLGAVVQLNGGQAVVEHRVAGPLGDALAPCASSASERWYFADGSTAKDATLSIALLNPFPEDAIADLSFTTEQGRAEPSDFQGVVVPAHGIAVVNVGEHVRRRESVATTVVARSGRLIAEQLQVRTAPGHSGMSLTPGAPSAGTVWYFPDGYWTAGVVEHYSVYNPTRTEALVELVPILDGGSAEPFDLTIPPLGRVVLVSGDQQRLPNGVGHGMVAHSTNGVPVVVDRTVEANAAPRAGRAQVLGARRAATRWALATGQASEAIDEWIVVLNPGPRTASVSLTGLAEGQPLAIEVLQDLAVPAGGRVALRLTDHVKRDVLPLVVSATAPVVVERDLYAAKGPGLSAVIAIPLN